LDVGLNESELGQLDLVVGRRRDLLGGLGRDDRFRLAGRGWLGPGGNRPFENCGVQPILVMSRMLSFDLIIDMYCGG
jgi:hypothetical protein